MGALVANTGNINSQLTSKISAKPTGVDIDNIPTSSVEEDESSLSSSGTDRFDRSSNDSSARAGGWEIDTAGTWRRFGSSESATSTGLSSICSSIAAEDKSTQRKSSSLTPSKKRLSDGTVKRSNPERDESSQIVPHPASSDEQLSLPAVDTVQPPSKKRRGRPPNPDKQKAAATGHPPKVRRASMISKLQASEVRPRSSIPARLPVDVFASQCIEAAHASRLNPYALHPGEHRLLADLLMNKEVTVYLNIRNTMLRLWVQNPLCSVTPEEAAGCAKDRRFFGLAEVAYKWLVRHGYINFGCVEVPRDVDALKKTKKDGRQKTVVVIGAGVSGLTTARQLEGLLAHSAERWTDNGERPPRVVVLEGRRRIGGRVYSKPLRSQMGSLPNNLRNTAEMGAMIVTGFEHGNPLDAIIRGQLGLRYHLMTDELTIYDCDGKPIDDHRDMLNTELYTDISDRAGGFRAVSQQQHTLHGDEDLVKRCRDPAANGFENFQLEPLFDPLSATKKRTFRRGRRRNAPPGTEKLTGRSRVIEESGATQSAARAAKTMGWQLRTGIARNQSISLHRIASASMYPTLGSVMDEAIEQYQDLIQLTPQDMRLLNWHHANLEYANAAPVSSLSLSGHDQDTGNEFEGAHSEIIGGYTQLPRGLMNLPTKLDVRFDHIVDSIHYDVSGDSESALTTNVVCTDGQVIKADHVVVTTPLGVLKSDMVDFDPPLPSWKRGAIDRMGFGLLNKVVLLYDAPFWDDDRDMFGLLNEADHAQSLDPVDYEERRGRFYLIWNASKTSGRPMLVALMAGHAAHEVEKTDTTALLGEINERLGKVFAPKVVPAPLEVIVTRWKRDPFTRGTYSYVAPETRSGDYDLMAKPVGNLHFAGEATCGTHPATVHGAFLSGLRVAAEVMESLAGPITLPSPLVGAPLVKNEMSTALSLQGGMAPSPLAQVSLLGDPLPSASGPAPKQGRSWGAMGISGGPAGAMMPPALSTIKQEVAATAPFGAPSPHGSAPAAPPKGAGATPRQSVCANDPSFWAQTSFASGADLDHEAGVRGCILSRLGEKPAKPSRPGVNPFLLFTKAKWEECKRLLSRSDAAAAPSSSSSSSSAGRDLIRQTLGKWWKAAPPQVKQPYLEQSQQAQELADALRKEWEQDVVKYEAEARAIRLEYVREHPPRHRGGVAAEAGEGDAGGVSRRKTNVSACVVLDHS